MSDISEILKAKLNAPPGDPLEEARGFLQRYWGDEGMLNAIQADMEKTIALSPSSVVKGLQAIEALLLTPPPAGTLLDMVLWDANHPLDDPTEAGAKAWLQEMAEFTRTVLADQQPPRPTSPA